MDWKEILDVRLRALENEPALLVNGVRERYSFGRFLLNPCITLTDVVLEMKGAWNVASKKEKINELAWTHGPKWPCGCSFILKKL